MRAKMAYLVLSRGGRCSRHLDGFSSFLLTSYVEQISLCGTQSVFGTKGELHKPNTVLRCDVFNAPNKRGFAKMVQRKTPNLPQRDTRLVIDDFVDHVRNAEAIATKKHKCVENVIKCMEVMLPHDIALIIQTCKQGRYVNKAVLESCVNHVMSSRNFARTFSASHVSSIIPALGCLWNAHGCPPKFFRGFEQLLRKLVVVALEGENGSWRKPLTDRELVSVIHGLGLVFKEQGGLEIPENVGTLVDILLEKLLGEGRIGQCRAQDLVRVFEGCAQMGHHRMDAFEELCLELEVKVFRKRPDNTLSPKNLVNCHYMSRLFWALGKLNVFHKGLLDGLSGEIVNMLGEFKEQELSNVLYGLGRLDYVNEYLLLELCGEIVKEDRLDAYSGNQLSNIVTSLARLKFDDLDLLDALCTSFMDKDRLMGFSNVSISSIIYGLGVLEYRNKDLVETLCKVVGDPEKLHSFSSSAITSIILGLSKMGSVNVATIDALSNELAKQDKLASLSTRELGNAIHGLGQLNYSSKEVVSKLSSEMCCSNRFGQLTHRGLFNVVHGFCKLELDDAHALELLASECGNEDRVKNFTRREITFLLLNLGDLRVFNARVFSRLLERFEDRCEHVSMYAIGDSICGLGLVNDQMDHDFKLESIQPFLLSVLPTFKEQLNKTEIDSKYACEVCLALSQLKFYDSDLLNAVIRKLLRDEHVCHEGLVMILNACAKFNHRHKHLQRLIEQNNGNWGQMSLANELVDCMHDMMVLGLLTPPLFDQLCSQLTQCENLALSRNDYQILGLAGLWLKKSHGEFEFSNDVIKMVENAQLECKNACNMDHDIESSNGDGSLECRVKGCLGRLGIEWKRDSFQEGLIVMDIVVCGDPKIVIITKACGKFSINECGNGHRELGEFALKEALLKQHGFEVMNVTFEEWSGLTTESENEWMLKHLAELQNTNASPEDNHT